MKKIILVLVIVFVLTAAAMALHQNSVEYDAAIASAEAQAKFNAAHPEVVKAQQEAAAKAQAEANRPRTPAELAATRRQYAKIVDSQLLEAGIESETVTAKAGDVNLIIRDPLAGRVRMTAISKNSTLFENLRQLGFKKLIYTNGFEGDMYQGWTWDLSK